MSGLFSDETLMAFADGELNESEARKVAEHLETNEEARALVDAFRQSSSLAKAAYAEAIEEPPPQRLVDAILTSRIQPADDQASRSLVESLRTGAASPVTGSRQNFRGMHRYALPLAAGVALVIGSVIGASLGRQNTVTDTGAGLAIGEVPPNSTLFKLLERDRTGMPRRLAESTDLRYSVVATFRDNRSRICREFELLGGHDSASALASAIACRESKGEWHVVGAAQVQPPAAGDAFVPAGQSEKEALEGLLNVLGAGEVLAPELEERLIKNDWQD